MSIQTTILELIKNSKFKYELYETYTLNIFDEPLHFTGSIADIAEHFNISSENELLILLNDLHNCSADDFNVFSFDEK